MIFYCNHEVHIDTHRAIQPGPYRPLLVRAELICRWAAPERPGTKCFVSAKMGTICPHGL